MTEPLAKSRKIEMTKSWMPRADAELLIQRLKLGEISDLEIAETLETVKLAITNSKKMPSYFENVIPEVTVTKENAKFPSAAFRMQFTSNHDENSWNGSEKERMGEARFALAVLAATFEGMPLVYNGQEAGLEKRLRFFDKDTINWSNLELSRFYEKLLTLHQSNEALWAGDFGAKVKILSPEKEKNVLVFTREKNGKKVLVVINMSRTKQKINATERGIYGNYTDLFSGKAITLTANLKLELAPWEYKVYYK